MKGGNDNLDDFIADVCFLLPLTIGQGDFPGWLWPVGWYWMTCEG